MCIRDSVEEVDISRMEESLDDVQISEEEVSSGETEHSFSETEGDIPPAGRGAYTVSQPMICLLYTSRCV